MPEPDDLDSRLRTVGHRAAAFEDDGMLDRIVSGVLGLSTPLHRVGRFHIERSLGRGGMGTVFVAWDPELQRRVAVKMLRRDVGTNERRRAIIEAEARALARLADRHVVQVYETGEHEGALFVVMELVEGTSLEAWQSERRSVDEIVDKYVQAGRGLAAAHRAGLVHRDFKPANVLLRRDGEVRVADFGLALAVDRERTEDGDPSPDASTPSDRSRAGSGTREYMAPEQLAFGTADVRADQFSFCVALHEALCGRRPFDQARLRELALEPEAPPAGVGAGLPGWIAPIVARGLDPDPTRRWPTMDALVNALLRARVRRRRVALVLGAGALVAGGVWSLRAGEVQPSCDASSEIARVWDDGRAEVLRAVARDGPDFGAEAMERAAEQIDGYAARWLDVYAGACEAAWVSGTQTQEQFERTVDCLDRARVSLGYSIDLLLHAEPETLARASEIAAALPDPHACRDATPVAVPTSERERELLAHADSIELLLAAGRPRDAFAQSDAIDLHDADHHAAAAEAWYARGVTAATLARYDEAEAALLRAVGLAVANDARRTGLRATIDLLRLYAHAMADRDRTSIAAGLAEGWAQRVDLSPVERAEWAGARALAAQLHGDFAAAESLHREAIEALDAAHDPVRAARARLLLGTTLQALGRGEEARAMYERVREQMRASLGPAHPDVADAERALGSLALAEDRYDDAKRHLTAALEIQTAALGPEAVRRAGCLVGLADVASRRGELEAAVRAAEEAWALEQSLPRGHVDRGWGLMVLAFARIELGDYEASLTDHETLMLEWPARDPARRRLVQLNIGWLSCRVDRCAEARPSFEAVLAEEPRDSAWHRAADSGLADVELAEDRPAAAIERVRRVLREVSAAGVADAEAELVAELNWTLARALERTGSDDAAMLDAARTALEGYRGLPGREAQVAVIRELLARHAA